MVVYASPQLTGLNTNAIAVSHLWPFRLKIFSPVCAQMR
jgi:hypothetical protein